MWVTSFDFHFNNWSVLPSFVLNASSEIFYRLTCFQSAESVVVFFFICKVITFAYNFSFVDPV